MKDGNSPKLETPVCSLFSSFCPFCLSFFSSPFKFSHCGGALAWAASTHCASLCSVIPVIITNALWQGKCFWNPCWNTEENCALHQRWASSLTLLLCMMILIVTVHVEWGGRTCLSLPGVWRGTLAWGNCCVICNLALFRRLFFCWEGGRGGGLWVW